MTLFFRYAAFAAFISTLISCAPTDEHVLPFKERLLSGKPIVYNAQGEIPPGCQNRPWTDARLKPEEIQDLMLFGTLVDIRAGTKNCYQVGSQIAIQDSELKQILPGPALIQIERIVLGIPNPNNTRDFEDATGKVELDLNSKAKASELKSYFFSKMAQKLKSEVEFSSRERNGEIQITVMRYIRNSSDSRIEAAYAGKANERFEQSLSYFEVTTPGQTLKGCSSAWTQIRIPSNISKELWNMMVTGAIGTAWQVKTGAICFKDGEEIDVIDQETSQTIGRIKVLTIHQLTLNNLQPHLLILSKKSFDEVKGEIEKLFQNNGSGKHVNLFDFEIVGPSEVIP